MRKAIIIFYRQVIINMRYIKVSFVTLWTITICKTDVWEKLEKFRPNPLKFNFRAIVVTVCSMKKSGKFSEYPLFKILEKKLGLGSVISFANGNIKSSWIFGIAASTLFGKCLTVKNVQCTWYRLSNITVYSFHTLSTFLTVKNVTLTWYRLSNITVYSFHTLSPILFF